MAPVTADVYEPLLAKKAQLMRGRTRCEPGCMDELLDRPFARQHDPQEA
jgi:hypothetical protein